MYIVYENTSHSVDNVKKANSELEKCNSEDNQYTKILAYLFIFLGLFLLLLDYS